MPSKTLNFKDLSDGQSIPATVHWKDGDSGASKGVALVFHGGSFVLGSRLMNPQEHIDDLQDAGFVAVTPDYRLCPQVSLYEGPEQDARDAFRWCKSQLPRLMASEGVTIDPSKIVALGYSAGGTLALCLGSEEDPPSAIVDFYGAKCFRDEFWTTPLPAMAGLPSFDQSFLDRVYEEPLQTFVPISLEKSANASDEPSEGMPRMDMSVPRNAWLFSAMKVGTQMKLLIQDDDFDRVDPTNAFSSSFPPTMFIHGTADDLIPLRFSQKAHARLVELGVETKIALVEGKGHGFDIGLQKTDPAYTVVKEGISFLKEHV
ncbi:Alpha/Beta hydrolase protein [Xylariaceae sp. FL0016]|nr:Alpha/Beta hydrolase protein [Xylariaceae sp. FL0016]